VGRTPKGPGKGKLRRKRTKEIVNEYGMKPGIAKKPKAISSGRRIRGEKSEKEGKTIGALKNKGRKARHQEGHSAVAGVRSSGICGLGALGGPVGRGRKLAQGEHTVPRFTL